MTGTEIVNRKLFEEDAPQRNVTPRDVVNGRKAYPTFAESKEELFGDMLWRRIVWVTSAGRLMSLLHANACSSDLRNFSRF